MNFDAPGATNGLDPSPYMGCEEWYARMGAAEASGFLLSPHTKWWFIHESNCPEFYNLGAVHPCQYCAMIAGFTNPGSIALVSSDYITFAATTH